MSRNTTIHNPIASRQGTVFEARQKAKSQLDLPQPKPLSPSSSTSSFGKQLSPIGSVRTLGSSASSVSISPTSQSRSISPASPARSLGAASSEKKITPVPKDELYKVLKRIPEEFFEQLGIQTESSHLYGEGFLFTSFTSQNKSGCDYRVFETINLSLDSRYHQREFLNKIANRTEKNIGGKIEDGDVEVLKDLGIKVRQLQIAAGILQERKNAKLLEERRRAEIIRERLMAVKREESRDYARALGFSEDEVGNNKLIDRITESKSEIDKYAEELGTKANLDALVALNADVKLQELEVRLQRKLTELRGTTNVSHPELWNELLNLRAEISEIEDERGILKSGEYDQAKQNLRNFVISGKTRQDIAASTIQKSFRGYQERQAENQRRQDAATTIQSGVREFLARRQLAELKQEMVDYARNIGFTDGEIESGNIINKLLEKRADIKEYAGTLDIEEYIDLKGQIALKNSHLEHLASLSNQTPQVQQQISQARQELEALQSKDLSEPDASVIEKKQHLKHFVLTGETNEKKLARQETEKGAATNIQKAVRGNLFRKNELPQLQKQAAERKANLQAGRDELIATIKKIKENFSDFIETVGIREIDGGSFEVDPNITGLEKKVSISPTLDFLKIRVRNQGGELEPLGLEDTSKYLLKKLNDFESGLQKRRDVAIQEKEAATKIQAVARTFLARNTLPKLRQEELMAYAKAIGFSGEQIVEQNIIELLETERSQIENYAKDLGITQLLAKEKSNILLGSDPGVLSSDLDEKKQHLQYFVLTGQTNEQRLERQGRQDALFTSLERIKTTFEDFDQASKIVKNGENSFTLDGDIVGLDQKMTLSLAKDSFGYPIINITTEDGNNHLADDEDIEHLTSKFQKLESQLKTEKSQQEAQAKEAAAVRIQSLARKVKAISTVDAIRNEARLVAQENARAQLEQSRLAEEMALMGQEDLAPEELGTQAEPEVDPYADDVFFPEDTSSTEDPENANLEEDEYQDEDFAFENYEEEPESPAINGSTLDEEVLETIDAADGYTASDADSEEFEKSQELAKAAATPKPSILDTPLPQIGGQRRDVEAAMQMARGISGDPVLQPMTSESSSAATSSSQPSRPPHRLPPLSRATITQADQVVEMLRARGPKTVAEPAILFKINPQRVDIFEKLRTDFLDATEEEKPSIIGGFLKSPQCALLKSSDDSFALFVEFLANFPTLDAANRLINGDFQYLGNTLPKTSPQEQESELDNIADFIISLDDQKKNSNGDTLRQFTLTHLQSKLHPQLIVALQARIEKREGLDSSVKLENRANGLKKPVDFPFDEVAYSVNPQDDDPSDTTADQQQGQTTPPPPKPVTVTPPALGGASTAAASAHAPQPLTPPVAGNANTTSAPSPTAADPLEIAARRAALFNRVLTNLGIVCDDTGKMTDFDDANIQGVLDDLEVQNMAEEEKAFGLFYHLLSKNKEIGPEALPIIEACECLSDPTLDSDTAIIKIGKELEKLEKAGNKDIIDQAKEFLDPTKKIGKTKEEEEAEKEEDKKFKNRLSSGGKEIDKMKLLNGLVALALSVSMPPLGFFLAAAWIFMTKSFIASNPNATDEEKFNEQQAKFEKMMKNAGIDNGIINNTMNIIDQQRTLAGLPPRAAAPDDEDLTNDQENTAIPAAGAVASAVSPTQASAGSVTAGAGAGMGAAAGTGAGAGAASAAGAAAGAGAASPAVAATSPTVAMAATTATATPPPATAPAATAPTASQSAGGQVGASARGTAFGQAAGVLRSVQAQQSATPASTPPVRAIPFGAGVGLGSGSRSR